MKTIIAAFLYIVIAGGIPLWYAYTKLVYDDTTLNVHALTSALAYNLDDTTNDVLSFSTENQLALETEEFVDETHVIVKWFGIGNTLLGMLVIGYKSIFSLLKTHMDIKTLLRQHSKRK